MTQNQQALLFKAVDSLVNLMDSYGYTHEWDEFCSFSPAHEDYKVNPTTVAIEAAVKLLEGHYIRESKRHPLK